MSFIPTKSSPGENSKWFSTVWQKNATKGGRGDMKTLQWRPYKHQPRRGLSNMDVCNSPKLFFSLPNLTSPAPQPLTRQAVPLYSLPACRYLSAAASNSSQHPCYPLGYEARSQRNRRFILDDMVWKDMTWYDILIFLPVTHEIILSFFLFVHDIKIEETRKLKLPHSMLHGLVIINYSYHHATCCLMTLIFAHMLFVPRKSFYIFLPPSWLKLLLPASTKWPAPEACSVPSPCWGPFWMPP